MKFCNKNCYETFPHRKRSPIKKRNPSPKFEMKPYKKTSQGRSRRTYKKERKSIQCRSKSKYLQKRKKIPKVRSRSEESTKKKEIQVRSRDEIPTKKKKNQNSKDKAKKIKKKIPN